MKKNLIKSLFLSHTARSLTSIFFLLPPINPFYKLDKRNFSATKLFFSEPDKNKPLSTEEFSIEKADKIQKKANDNQSAWDNLVKEIKEHNKVLSHKEDLNSKDEQDKENYNKSQYKRVYAQFEQESKDRDISKTQSTEKHDFLSQIKNKVQFLREDRSNIREGVDQQLSVELKYVSTKSLKDFLEHWNDKEKLEISKADKRLSNLENEPPVSQWSVDHWNKKLDAEAATFKMEIQFKEKKEKEIYEFLIENLKGESLENFKKRRFEWKEGHDNAVRESRAEHKAIKEFANSKLESASQMMSDLQDENMPDNTAGDD